MKTAMHNNLTLSFDSHIHKYTVEETGQVMFSATTFIHDSFPKFDKEKISYFYARKHGMTQKEVLAMWEEKGRSSASFGTATHNVAEDIINGKIPSAPQDDRQAKSFANMEKAVTEISKYIDFLEPETMIFSPTYGIAGTMDLPAISKDKKTYFILDWKTNESIDKVSKYGKIGFQPISHIPDCNFSHYSLQLNLYQFILIAENYVSADTPFKLALIHINDKVFQWIPVPDLQSDIQLMLSHKLEREKYNARN